jgi:glutathione S-transferase
LKLQGFGRHTPAEQDKLAIADVQALAILVGDKPYLMGDRPCGADAAVFAFVEGILTPVFETAIRTEAEKHQNLVRYRDRILRQYFPD